MNKSDWEKLIGTNLGASEWWEITQEQINQFADVTLDHQAIHVDEEFARNGPFGTTVAHGYLCLSLVPKLMYPILLPLAGDAVCLNYGCNKLRFISPVRVNSKVRIHISLDSVQEKQPNNLLLSCSVTMEIEGADKPAFLLESLFMIVPN